MRVFAAALLTVPRPQKQPKHSSQESGITSRYFHPVEHSRGTRQLSEQC